MKNKKMNDKEENKNKNTIKERRKMVRKLK